MREYWELKQNEMIDNIEIIKSLLKFEKEGDFYMLYVFQRKKDQEDKDNHQSVRTIKSYCIESIEYLDKKYSEIKLLCETFKARAYIHVCSQNHKDVSLDMISKICERLKQNQFNQKNVFDSVVGQIKTREKYWIIDVDGNEPVALHAIIDSLRPEGPKVIAKIPTKNGVHLITERFDVMEFKKMYPHIDIQKKNPTLLYYPNSLL